jgi:hypothetical protein
VDSSAIQRTAPSATVIASSPDAGVATGTSTTPTTTTAVVADGPPTPTLVADSHPTTVVVAEGLPTIAVAAAAAVTSPAAVVPTSNGTVSIGTDGLRLKFNNRPEYRLSRVDISRGDGIDSIKMTYDDASIWCHGHDGGKEDNRPMILTEGEYLVRVTHETFLNHKAAAAAVEFETNKGRVFEYHPLNYATKWDTECTTVTAQTGHEIVGLTIRHGVLIGSEQQPVPATATATAVSTALTPAANAPPEWFAIATLFPKEDKEDTAEEGAAGGASAASCRTTKSKQPTMDCEGVVFKQFESELTARTAWQELKRTAVGQKQKQGRGAAFFNVKALELISTVGNECAIKKCKEKAIEAGLHAHKKDEDVSILDAIVTLYKLLAGKKDLITFILTTSLIATASFL